MDIKKTINDICMKRYPQEQKYVATHLNRYAQSYLYIKYLIGDNVKILNLGGSDHGSTFVDLIKELHPTCTISSYNKDLRYSLDVPDNSFDIILNMEVIEHINDRNSNDISVISQFNFNGINSLFSECFRILKKGGHLFLTTPNLASFDCILKILHGNNPYHYYPHCREFTYKEILEYIEKHNFKIIKSETIDSWGSIKYNLTNSEIADFLKIHNLNIVDRKQNTFVVAQK